MAYTKKADCGETTTTKRTTTQKKESPAKPIEEKVEGKIDQQNEIDVLKAQIELLTKMLANQKNERVADSNEDVKIVHMIQCYDGLKTHIQISNREIDMSVIGETRRLSIKEAEEVASKYRKFFETGVIAFDKSSKDFADKFDLGKFIAPDTIHKDFVEYVGKMNMGDLETFYHGLGEAQKAFLIETFKRQIYEGDARFKNMAKIQLLESLTMVKGETNGAMEGILIDSKLKN